MLNKDREVGVKVKKEEEAVKAEEFVEADKENEINEKHAVT